MYSLYYLARCRRHLQVCSAGVQARWIWERTDDVWESPKHSPSKGRSLGRLHRHGGQTRRRGESQVREKKRRGRGLVVAMGYIYNMSLWSILGVSTSVLFTSSYPQRRWNSCSNVFSSLSRSMEVVRLSRLSKRKPGRMWKPEQKKSDAFNTDLY